MVIHVEKFSPFGQSVCFTFISDTVVGTSVVGVDFRGYEAAVFRAIANVVVLAI
jgi:hypothetical protein